MLEFEDKLVRQYIVEISVMDERLEFHVKSGTSMIVKEQSRAQ